MIRVELHLTIAGAAADEPTNRGARLTASTDGVLTELVGRLPANLVRAMLGVHVEVDRFETYEVGGSWPDDDDDDDDELVYGDDPPTIDLAAVLGAYQHAREVMGPRPWSPAAEDVVGRLADVWRPQLGPPDRKRVTTTAEGLALVDPAEVEAGDWRSELMAAVGQATGVAPPPDELRPELDAIAARVRSGETTLEEAVEAVTELRSRWAAESSQLEERSPDRDA